LKESEPKDAVDGANPIQSVLVDAAGKIEKAEMICTIGGEETPSESRSAFEQFQRRIDQVNTLGLTSR
jgi:hypothetical protein